MVVNPHRFCRGQTQFAFSDLDVIARKMPLISRVKEPRTNPSRNHGSIKLPLAVRAVLWAMLPICMVGCGGDPTLAPVRGQVLLDGEPLPFGNISFQPEAGQPAQGAIGPDGQFELVTYGHGDGGTIGKNRVSVTCFDSQDPSRAENGAGEATLGKSLIPQKYNNFDTSGLTHEISSDHTEPILIELSSK